MTVRNNKNKIIQFSYGDDNISTMKVESQNLPIVNMTTEQLYAHFQIPEITSSTSLNYTKKTIANMKKQKKKLIKKTKKILKFIIEKKHIIVDNVFKFQNTTNVHVPVHFNRIKIGIIWFSNSNI